MFKSGSKNTAVKISAKEYIKYSSKENEKQAIEAIANYYNTRRFIKLMQTT